MEDIKDTTKSQFYQKITLEIKGLLQDEPDLIANTANVASLIFNELNNRTPDICNWAGFYFMRNGGLVLGPFMGQPACVRLTVGKGVCGTAVSTGSTQRIEDVHKFPGHVACDARSNSEIVIPITAKKEGGEEVIVGVLDLDSEKFSAFDEEDQRGLEEISKLVANSTTEWPALQ